MTGSLMMLFLAERIAKGAMEILRMTVQINAIALHDPGFDKACKLLYSR
jgi:hypothetical protein